MRSRRECAGRWAMVGGVAALLALTAVAHGEEQPPPPVPYLRDADLNHDLILDRLDFAKFVECWATYHASGTVSPAIAGADFNKDGKIDRLDALHLIEQWILYGPTPGGK